MNSVLVVTAGLLLLLLMPVTLAETHQVQHPANVECLDGQCRSWKPQTLPSPSPTCWSAKVAAVALLDRQCELADCEKSATFADPAVGGPIASQGLLHRLFAFVDNNGDGLATQAELAAAVASISSSKSGSLTACIDDVLLTAGGRDGGFEDTGVGRRRFAALLGIRFAKSVDDAASRQDEALSTLIEEGSELQLTAPVGRDFRLRCPLTAVGKAEAIQWRRHGHRIRVPPGRGRMFSWQLERTGVGAAMLLKSVMPADAGIYQCCSSVWRRLCLNLALNVIDRPRIRVHPPMQVRRVGESARLYCRVEGGAGPVDDIRWLLNSEPVETRPGVAFVGAATETGSSLSIAKLGKHHTGLYTCRVDNKAGLAESAGSVYVRDATETDYSSYPLSPQIWTANGPTPTKAVVFHSDGYAILDVVDCAVKNPVSARMCDCQHDDGSSRNDKEQLAECDWLDEGGRLLAVAGRALYAAQPSQHRLLAIQLAASTASAWFTPQLLPLGCRPKLLSYRRLSDTLWTACDSGRVLRLSRASSTASVGVDVRRPTVWRVGSARDRVLRLPDSSSNLLVTLGGSSASNDGLALMVAVGVPDYDDDRNGDGDERARLLVPNLIDRADVIPQGDTLLLHSSKNSSRTPLIAVDLTTGKRIPFFSRFFSSDPTGRLVVSERRDRVLHLTDDTMYLYRVLPSGQLALSMHTDLDVRPLDPQFQTGPDGTERLLAIAELPEGGLMTVSPGEAATRLTFDPHLGGLSRLSAPDFGSLAVAYSADSAVFVNASADAPSGLTAACPQSSLFVGLQSVHWIWPD